MLSRRVVRSLDDRLGTSKVARTALDKAFPDHWSFLIGEIALYSLIVLIVTGTFLTFFFEASSRDVVYHGRYVPLHGTHMSAAYRSTVAISQDVRGGLLVRQMHHWAALVFIAAIVCHLCRIFFTGAFRRPREINWLIGLTLLILSIANGFTGYSMPDDLLSGTGLRIAYSIAISVPLAGPVLASLFFGGATVGPQTVGRLYAIHILLVPGLIIGLLTAHLAIVWRQKHTQFAGVGRREDNVVGTRMWPTYAARSVGLLVLVGALIALLGALVQINPVWLYGPYEPAAVSTAAQPDWYLGWTEGALRLMPSFHLHVLGYRVPEIFVPGVLLPAVTFGLLFSWPFLEKRITKDRAEHHLLDRPRDRPWRSALGVAVLTFYVVLFGAGAQDIWASNMNVSVIAVRNAFRVAVFVLPVLAGAVSFKVFRDLKAAVPPEEFASTGVPPDVGDLDRAFGRDGGDDGPGDGDDDAAGNGPVPAGAGSEAGHGRGGWSTKLLAAVAGGAISAWLAYRLGRARSGGRQLAAPHRR